MCTLKGPVLWWFLVHVYTERCIQSIGLIKALYSLHSVHVPMSSDCVYVFDVIVSGPSRQHWGTRRERRPRE